NRRCPNGSSRRHPRANCRGATARRPTSAPRRAPRRKLRRTKRATSRRPPPQSRSAPRANRPSARMRRATPSESRPGRSARRGRPAPKARPARAGPRPPAAPPAGDVQDPTAPSRDVRDAAPRSRAATAPSIAATRAQPTAQMAPLSRTGPMTGIPAAPPDVSAQLRATDVSAAERSLIELAPRVGGRQTGRRIDGGRVVVELAVPRDAYAEFVREAAALGALSIESQGTDRPVLAVAVSVGI